MIVANDQATDETEVETGLDNGIITYSNIMDLKVRN